MPDKTTDQLMDDLKLGESIASKGTMRREGSTEKAGVAQPSSYMDRFRNLVTGGASDTLKGAVTHKNMNYYHEDDGK